MYPGIELRLQRYAVALAEELNFTRAAERVHVAQPAFSRSIRQLEDQLGVNLFARSSRRVELTDAGQNFVYEAKKALYHSERAVLLTHHQRAGSMEQLVVGYSAYIDLDLIAKLKELTIPGFPSVEICYEGGSPAEILSSIRRGDWHCGLVVLPIDEHDLSVVPLLRLPLVVAIPRTGAIAKKRPLEIADLRGQRLVILARRVNPAFRAWLVSKLMSLGLGSRDLHTVSSPQEAEYLVSHGAAIAIANAGAFRESADGIVVRRIQTPGLETEVALALRRGTRSVLFNALVNRIIALAQQRPEPAWTRHWSA